MFWRVFGPVHVQLTLVTRSLVVIDLILIDEEGDGDGDDDQSEEQKEIFKGGNI